MGLQTTTGADRVDSSFDDALAITPSDTISQATRLSGVRALRADVGGNVTVVTSEQVRKGDQGKGPTDFGGVSAVAITGQGNYTVLPTGVTFTGGGGTGATGVVVGVLPHVTGVTVTNKGAGYTSPPTVGFTGGTGTAATATASVDAPAVSLLLNAGEILPLRVGYVLAQGTDATGIKALF